MEPGLCHYGQDADGLSQLHLTPREAERLRNVSYQRQVEAGMKNPGNAGLTAQRLGDANPWTPDEHSSNGEIKALR